MDHSGTGLRVRQEEYRIKNTELGIAERVVALISSSFLRLSTPRLPTLDYPHYGISSRTFSRIVSRSERCETGSGSSWFTLSLRGAIALVVASCSMRGEKELLLREALPVTAGGAVRESGRDVAPDRVDTRSAGGGLFGMV
jgi:hypothetical protein